MEAYIQSSTLSFLAPEMVLAAFGVAIFLVGAFSEKRPFAAPLGGLGLLISAMLLAGQDGTSRDAGVLLAADGLSYAVRWGALGLGGLLLLMATSRQNSSQPAEYIGSLLLLLTGVMLVAAADELVLMFVGLELVSIPTYVLLYVGRSDAAGQESTIKYFFLSILSSALLLYGFSFLYGMAGSTELDQLATALSVAEDGGTFSVARLGMILVFAGLGFRITAVPFHFYAADVYEGTSQTNACLLSTAPKIVGMLALVRITVASMPGMEPLGWKIAIVLAMLTMTVGNVMALWQDNLRRMLAYSSVAHGGYMLIGLAVAFAAGNEGAPQFGGVGAILFYLIVYSLSTIGTFAALAFLGSARHRTDGVDDLAGLNRTHPLLAIALAVFMFSLTGIPPLAGFWGKFMLFMAALDVDTGAVATGEVRPWFIALAVVGVINAAISAAYYLRIVAVMYFRTPLATAKAEGGPLTLATTILCTIAVVLAGLWPTPLMESTQDAGASAERPLTHAAPAEQPVEAVAANAP